jgi:flagellar protein FliJ
VPGPSFRFSLERVRAVRERRERLAQQELARSMNRLAGSEEQLRSIEHDIERARDEQRGAAAGGPVGAEALRERQAFLERIEAERGRREAELERSEAGVQESGARLTTAATEHEMLKRLRERRRGEHNREVARLEAGVLDELATARYQRRMA